MIEGFRGQVLQAGDAGYDEARTVWNGMIDKRPALIARCTGTADVVAALAHARAAGLDVAVRGGGHNVAGNAVNDGGLVIDVSPMQGIRVDPAEQRVRAQGGVTWGALDHETQLHGLATVGGVVSTTGIAGLTLGGGIGQLTRRYGLACDNLTSVDVVTAGGEVVTASDRENTDLFWALRGGGGNFGVATSFEFKLHPVGPIVVGGLMAWQAEKRRDVLEFYREFVRTMPDELGLNCLFLSAPPLPFIPAELHFQPIVAIAGCYAGAIEEGQAATAALHEFGPPDVDLIGPMPYVALQQMFDDGFPRGIRTYWKAGYLPELSDGAVDAYVEQTAAIPSPMTLIECQVLGGAFAASNDSAFGNRDAAFLYNIVAAWTDPSEDDTQVAWARSMYEAMRPHETGGVYVNYLTDEGQDRVKAAYGPERYARLQAVKAKYDPENVFRGNQNIQP
jgi:FAD/FMN-containing dehydrogenase